MSKEVIFTDRVMQPIAHFAHAVRIGNVVHLGATAGTDAQRRLAGVTPGRIDVDAQIGQMFENAKVVLELLGARPEHAVRIKTYLTDLRDLPCYEARYREAYGSIHPNHVVVGSAGFPLPQAAIELDMVAVVDAPVERFPRAGDAVRASGRYYCAATPVASPDAEGVAAQQAFAAQADSAFEQLRARLAAGGHTPADTVYLHATLGDCRFADAFSSAFGRCFPSRPPACAVVIAALPDADWMLQLEAVAAEGGGTPIETTEAPAAAHPGSAAMLAGDDLFIGGQYGLGVDGRLAGGVEAQTRAAWSRITALLRAAGMTAEDILRTNNVLTDWRGYPGFNRGYGANVTEPYPPRATVLGALAAQGALVQIEALANRGGHAATIVQASQVRPGTSAMGPVPGAAR